MPKFSQRSKDRLKGVHPKLVEVLETAIEKVDFSVLEGLRTKERQEELVADGKSKTMNSKHLIQADGYGHAVDVAPWPIDWSDRERFVLLAGILRGIAIEKGIDLRLGVDWDGDLDVKEHSFFDGPHVEIKL
jgi:peptidoglycan L-alanyl-D-glutamate endopeptidase CwlK